MGRPSIPIETYLRLMFLKFRYDLGYERLCRETADSISWQRFCRIPLGVSPPHPTTLMKITRRCGEDAVAGLNEALIAKARETKALRTDRVRADTTVVAANVGYPTDSGLLTKAIRKIPKAVAVIKGAALSTYFTYSAYGDPLTVKDPVGHLTQRTYDANRNLQTVTDGDNHTTTFTYDAANELVRTQRPDGTVLLTDYWPDGSVNHQYDAANQATTFVYDPLARLSTVTDPLGRTTSLGYDPTGNRTSQQDPGGDCSTAPKAGCTSFSYDFADQLTGVTYSDGTTPEVANITYDPDGQRTGMTDGSGTWTFTWDSLHRMTSSAQGSSSVGYSWDLRSKLTSISYPNGVGTVSRTYDDAGRLRTITDWLAHTTTFDYDPDSNPTTQTYPNGASATQTFDAAERLMKVSHAPTATPTSPFASFTYGRDNAGLVTSVTSTGVPPDNHTWGYNALNELVTDTAAPSPYAYDPADNLTQFRDGTQQAFDAANQLTTNTNLSLAGVASAGNASTPNPLVVGLPSGIQPNDQILVAATLPGSKSVTTPSGYTVVGTWASGTKATDDKLAVFRKTAVGGEVSVSLSFSNSTAKAVVVAVYRGVDPATPVDLTPISINAAGTQITFPGLTPTVPGAQLVGLFGANASSVGTWTAPTGMTKQREQAGATSMVAAVSDQRLPTANPTGSKTASYSVTGKLVGVLLTLRPLQTRYAYDTRGNRTTKTIGGTTTTLGYDQANRLTTYTSGATTANLAYNADGLRTAKTVGSATTGYSWDQAEALPLILTEAATAYVYGPGGLPLEQINGNSVLYYHHDQLGSTRALSNITGTVVATATYDPYGKPAGTTGSTANPFGFTGQYTDPESGFIYLRARYYDPVTGQFLTRDPMVAVTRSAYAYADNNPVNFTDPTGRYCFAGKNPNGSCRGSGAVETVREAAQDTGEFIVRNRGTIATIGAAGTCLVPVVGLAGCGYAAAGAFAIRAEQRVRDDGFSNSLGANLADGALTFLTFGLAGAFESLAGPWAGVAGVGALERSGALSYLGRLIPAGYDITNLFGWLDEQC